MMSHQLRWTHPTLVKFQFHKLIAPKILNSLIRIKSAHKRRFIYYEYLHKLKNIKKNMLPNAPPSAASQIPSSSIWATGSFNGIGSLSELYLGNQPKPVWVNVNYNLIIFRRLRRSPPNIHFKIIQSTLSNCQISHPQLVHRLAFSNRKLEVHNSKRAPPPHHQLVH